ncbi:RNA polymerase sigma factor [Thermoflexibacter ruber]|uniref:RNA polymerase sigma factor, sigma-70 family n=1 Tax=Thermoflexibacter ruber TaxID=1003 RepID=A0A1I2JFR9_9BACT|nr:sigma-70 family RNA polymerase sigma factor [Thermoflexibacter ruber]SFF53404.1 RNA polymerase sigma factor, sigma-70 family [Thermoflexibacter ruber]
MRKSDYEIWQELKQGKEEAITQMMQYYHADLYQYSLKIAGDADLSKDCIQEVFMEIWTKREKLADVQYIKPYLFKSLRRRIIHHKNQKKKELENLEVEFDIVFSHEDFLVQELNLQEKQAKLVQALNQLSKRQREAIYLRFYEGLNYEQIAEIMGITYQPLYNLIYKSLKLLREYMTVFLLMRLYFLYLPRY